MLVTETRQLENRAGGLKMAVFFVRRGRPTKPKPAPLFCEARPKLAASVRASCEKFGCEIKNWFLGKGSEAFVS